MASITDARIKDSGGAAPGLAFDGIESTFPMIASGELENHFSVFYLLDHQNAINNHIFQFKLDFKPTIS